MFLPKSILEEKIRTLLEEDIGQGDITTALIVPPETIVEAEVIAKEAGVIAGVDETRALLESVNLQAETLLTDGSRIEEKTTVMKITGDARTLLSIERTLLNLLSRMSGIATTTSRLVNKVRKAGYKTRIACTRKVAPGLLYFDKKAVMLGGGDTHRLHLDDLVLIKDNHLTIIGDITEAVKKAGNAVSFSKRVEVEVANIKEALKAAKAGADIIMLDNFSPQQVKKATKVLEKEKLRDNVLIEASGRITEQNILKYAATGINILSLGELTSSAETLDISLEVTETRMR
ncbi:MAG: carboxylating nicotinate-nucleotide diphosphorylase [Candidatus Bathyarchaeota archaeon]|nr:MAG: carboxylating nicotinate-nucleotide diphosphorylase [Candidatus Bathyarchaeota archaeon]